jgi:PIN domain nuclease of toxin-antitoxin system
VLLLDTCALIWLAITPGQLSPVARVRIDEEPLFVSAISAWEIGLKVSIGKLTLPDPPEVWYPAVLAHHGVRELPLTGRLSLAATALPRLHNDPADRFIIATAAHDGLAIVTPDYHIRQYPQATVVW